MKRTHVVNWPIALWWPRRQRPSWRRILSSGMGLQSPTCRGDH